MMKAACNQQAETVYIYAHDHKMKAFRSEKNFKGRNEGHSLI